MGERDTGLYIYLVWVSVDINCKSWIEVQKLFQDAMSPFNLKKSTLCCFPYGCKIQYVGQMSNALHVRLQQHLRDIKQSNQYKAVSHHFTSTHHNPVDLTITAVYTASGLNTRLCLQEAWITQLGTQKPAGLNQQS